MRIKFCFIITALIFLLIPNLMPAHDLWLVPEKYIISPGQPVTIFANTGMDFPKSLNAVLPGRVSRSVLVGKSGEETLTGLAVKGKSLIAGCTIKNPGTYVAAISIHPKEIKLKAKEFNEYLLHDGLSAVYKLREKEGILDKDAVEYYSKYAKTIIQSGDTQDDTPTRPLHLPIEIVPAVNPYKLKRGDSLKVAVLFKGKPLPGAELAWSFPGMGEKFAGTTKTGNNGNANIPLTRSGPYVIRLTHMEWVKKKTHEWESFWASLTFEVK
ncbi:MAG: DUF4198 domain-containing protein [Candidatus Aminicenantes bacterium]|nr:DUF4198 domain-containing protein [Candidatus Aminicenantes bacterium]NIN40753.1 DUF4198 domain-containing protein [Candidatus Aminicenantes bacterium]NIR04235.1 DUF4198 domain-containing protein [Candidatus Aminicenantes bacterium]